MDWPAPTRADHQRFCETEGWKQVRDARGRTGTHHVTYEFERPDGAILRTRISHPVNRDNYGSDIWKHILRDQLQVDAATFWACVHDKQRPDRGAPEMPSESIPAGLVALLIRTIGVPEAEVALMTRDQAIARSNAYWTTGT